MLIQLIVEAQAYPAGTKGNSKSARRPHSHEGVARLEAFFVVIQVLRLGDAVDSEAEHVENFAIKTG